MSERLPVFETAPLIEQWIGRDRSLSMAVIEVVASISNTRIESQPPLYDAMDPDLLDGSFARSGTGLIAFPYNGYIVSVSGDRTVAVYEG